LAADRPGQTLIADRQYYGTTFEATLAAWHLHLLRPARKGERDRPGAPLFKPLRQTPATSDRGSWRPNLLVSVVGVTVWPRFFESASALPVLELTLDVHHRFTRAAIAS
jgi:hypothetical protein